MSDSIRCTCGETYCDAECFVAHYRECRKAARAQESGGAVAPFVLGNSYQTLSGEWVRFVKVHNEGSSYETMADESGVNRYTNRPGDMGRVTASPIDYPGNVPPLYTHPAPSVPDNTCEHGIRHPHPCRECEDRERPVKPHAPEGWRDLIPMAKEYSDDRGGLLGDAEIRGWNLCRIEALNNFHAATPQPSDNWIKCSERLPTEADEDPFGFVVMLWTEGVVLMATSEHVRSVFSQLDKEYHRHLQWTPTGLKRPTPPAEGA